jgi:hypothetical protein
MIVASMRSYFPFGSWFLRRPEGHVEMLHVFTGRLPRLADSHDEFIREVEAYYDGCARAV